MKIKIYNPNNQIQTAFVRATDLSLSIYVNFRDRDVYHYWVQGPGNLELCVYDQEPTDDEHQELDRVLFIAENDDEKGFLDCVHFNLMSKDQLWTIFVKDEVWKNGSDAGSVEYVNWGSYQNLLFDGVRKYLGGSKGTYEM